MSACPHLPSLWPRWSLSVFYKFLGVVRPVLESGFPVFRLPGFPANFFRLFRLVRSDFELPAFRLQSRKAGFRIFRLFRLEIQKVTKMYAGFPAFPAWDLKISKLRSCSLPEVCEKLRIFEFLWSFLRFFVRNWSKMIIFVRRSSRICPK